MGFLDSSSSTNEYTQNVSTTTQTKVGDVGITGIQAVAMNKQVADSLSSVSRDNAASYKTFAGNTNNIVNASLNANTGVTKSAFDYGAGAIKAAYNDLSKAREVGSKKLTSILGDVSKARSSNTAIVSRALDQATQSAGNLSNTTMKYGTMAVMAIAAMFLLKGKL